jgi:hypothetical protein
MTYIRIYPSRNNTIFKRINGGQTEILGTVNTGKNPISEITDGNTQSAFLMNFDISGILPRLTANTYTCNLKLWDSGQIFEPSITLKTVDLLYFEEEFIEGDGFTYLGVKALPQASNWLERVTGSSWTPSQPTYFDTKIIDTMQLNSANEDLFFEGIEASIASAITNTVNPNFAIRISTNTISDQTFTKFLFTRHTRTVFKPFLEFFIDDTIIDERLNTVATIPANIFLLNETGANFTGTLTNEIQDADATVLFTPTINNPSTGVYYVTVTPTAAMANTSLFDVWSIDGVPITKNIIQVKSPNQVGVGKVNTENLFFYPATSYLHQSIRKNDVVTFNVTSEVRGKGSVILTGYEYRIVSTNNFEIQPWTSVSTYGNRLFFTVDTSYYYAPLEYEVFVRLKEGKSIKTSAMSYKFKLIADEASHMQSLAANPYSNRDAGFKPNKYP